MMAKCNIALCAKILYFDPVDDLNEWIHYEPSSTYHKVPPNQQARKRLRIVTHVCLAPAGGPMDSKACLNLA